MQVRCDDVRGPIAAALALGKQVFSGAAQRLRAALGTEPHAKATVEALAALTAECKRTGTLKS